VLFALFALGEYAMQFRSSFINRGGVRAERWSLLVVGGTVVGGLVGGVKLATWQNTAMATLQEPLFVLGLALMAAGVGVRQWAIVVLGRFFTADVRVRADQTVVEGGPYRWVRHPSYSGLILFFVGLGLALSNWASLATLALVPTAGLVVRIHAEEKALLATLGDPYRRFAATRPRLFPGPW
jgi:protein-S-isoprenylcysteine O-methyltransferase Ste14